MTARVWTWARGRIGSLLLGTAVLGACTQPVPQPPVPAARPEIPVALPKMNTFGSPRPLAPQRANAVLAEDFLDLVFRLESGRTLEVFTRFEGQITIATDGVPSDSLNRELDRLITRLRREARLPVRRVPHTIDAAIVVEAIPSAELSAVLPQAACFVLPTRTDWNTFKVQRRSPAYDWARLRTRDAITVFIPADTSPQDIRDCLHEEIAQGLAPVNDLYRLPDSVFNDDNFHAVLTGFDMLMLRVAYDARLRSGMSYDQVAAVLPDILSSVNPRGNRIEAPDVQDSSDLWVREMTTALTAGRPISRRFAAQRALRLAEAMGWDDTRTALSHFMLGRLSMTRDDGTALREMLRAGEIYKRSTETQVQAAHVGFHLATFGLGTGQWQASLALADRWIPVALRYENAALLSDLLLVKAAALRGLDQDDRSVMTEALAWGRYAWGPDARVQARAAEIAALAATPVT